MLWRKLMLLFRKNQAAQDLEDEVHLHLHLRAKQLRDAGSSEEASRDQAARQFGNATLIKETTREMWTFSWIEQLLRDLRFATRALRKSPSFSLVAIASLAIALGANTTVFSFVRAIVLKTLSVKNADRLVILRQRNEMFHMDNCCFTYRFFQELRKQDTGFEEILALNDAEIILTDQEQTEKLTAEIVSGNYFAMLGVHPAMGRLIEESDDQSEGSQVCVISYRLWQERFGGRTDAIGRRVLINNAPFQIIGVSERGFDGAALHQPRDLQIPAAAAKPVMGEINDSTTWAEIIARLKPGVAVEQASARLNVVGLAIENEFGPHLSGNSPFFMIDGSQGVASGKEQFGKPVLLLLGLVGVVLIIACANLTALLLVRSVERTTEAGVRLALGGSRLALIRHFLAESIVLAIAGGIAAWGLAQLLTHALLKMLGPGADGLQPHVRPDGPIFAFSTALSLAAGFMFGLLPAWRASRCDPLRAIRGIENPAGRSIAARVLIAAQIALSLALLFGAGLFVRTLHNLRSIDVGFRPENLALLHLDLSHTAYGSSGSEQFFEDLLHRARELPETRAASLSTISILSGSMQSVIVRIPGYVSPNRMTPVTYFTTISSGYFRTLGEPLIAGRDFTPDDRATGTAEGVAIVNQQFAKQFFAGGALDKAFKYGSGRSVRIVGIAGNAHFRWLREDPQPVMYLPVTQWTYPQHAYLQVRASAGATAALERLRGLVREMDERVPIDSIATMEMQIDQALARERLLAFLSTLTGGIAVALAAIGLYGVMSFTVARRTREIGIRMAVGAPRAAILNQFLSESAWILLGGIALGIPLALGCGRMAAALLYGLTPQDQLTAAVATAILAMIATAAAIIPAWRAARMDPMSALRWE
jgi:predicted permease